MLDDFVAMQGLLAEEIVSTPACGGAWLIRRKGFEGPKTSHDEFKPATQTFDAQDVGARLARRC